MFTKAKATAALIGVAVFSSACYLALSNKGLKQAETLPLQIVHPWSQFRGENGQGDCSGSVIPTHWDNETNTVWKTRLAGRGASTPIIVDDNVFVTAYTGYGIEPGDKTRKSDLRLHLICLDRESGKQKWQRTIKGSPAAQRPSENSLIHGSASSTPVCDGGCASP
jgi:hypothetical protein